MVRRSLLLAAVTVGASLAFAATSAALRDGAPGLRGNLQAKNIPTVALSGDDRIAANNAIGAALAAEFGIEESSFDAARLITVTSRGPLYLIPGTNGACLVVDGGSSCGEPGRSGHRILALATNDPATGTWVGGGISDDATAAVRVRDRNGRTVVLPSRRGTFVIDSSAQLDSQGGAQFTPQGR